MVPQSVRVLRARLGGLAVAARYDGRATTARARATFIASFSERVIAEASGRGEELTEAEISRRAEALRRYWYTQQALKSVQSRARNKKTAAAKAEAASSELGSTDNDEPTTLPDVGAMTA